MVRIIILGALVLALIVGTVIGCGPRAGVAADKMIAQLDKVLGELDVKRKSIEQNQKKIQSEMRTLRDKRIGTEVRLEQLEKKKAASEDELAKSKANLKRLRDLIEEVQTSGSIEKNGKTYTAEDLQKIAGETTRKYTSAEANVTNLQTSIEALTRSVNFLKTQESTSKELMDKLEGKISEIDSKKVAIDAVRHASSVAGDDKSVSDRINALNKEIDEMFIDVETAMRVEESKLTELQSQTSSADELLAEPQDLNATMAEIDALLGKDGANN